jgi:hypothetical protein
MEVSRNGEALNENKKINLHGVINVARVVRVEIIGRSDVVSLKQASTVRRVAERRVVASGTVVTSVEGDGEGEARDDDDGTKGRKKLGTLSAISNAQRRANVRSPHLEFFLFCFCVKNNRVRESLK